VRKIGFWLLILCVMVHFLMFFILLQEILILTGVEVRLALQTAKAIDVLHSSNQHVIHRDIKSANVLIDQDAGIRKHN